MQTWETETERQRDSLRMFDITTQDKETGAKQSQWAASPVGSQVKCDDREGTGWSKN